ncbi:MAG TPA: hypothetical protein VGR97_12040 [Candidatus Acidoferrales bacterium]|nr:hypothetical protein [Candidatus Acidoferrales bacterium]
MVELRQQYGWGAKKIRVLLEEEGISLPLTTIHRILKRRDLIGLKESHAPALERFERAAPNELWQMDGKGEYRASDGICYPLSILDDHSRYVVGLYALGSFSAEKICGVRELVYPELRRAPTVCRPACRRGGACPGRAATTPHIVASSLSAPRCLGSRRRLAVLFPDQRRLAG